MRGTPDFDSALPTEMKSWMVHENDAVEGIRRMLRSIPPNYGEWYYGKVVAFKKAAHEASLSITGKRQNPARIERCYRELRRLFES